MHTHTLIMYTHILIHTHIHSLHARSITELYYAGLFPRHPGFHYAGLPGRSAPGQGETAALTSAFLSVSICMYVYCMCVDMHSCMHTWMHTCMHTWMRTCMYKWMHTCMHTWMYTWMSMHATLGLDFCTFTYIQTHTYTGKYTAASFKEICTCTCI